MIVRLILRDHTDCAGCGVPLLPGEVGYRDTVTGTIGHSKECCADAVGELLDHHEHALFLSAFDLNAQGVQP
jgi:hypothetical protein